MTTIGTSTPTYDADGNVTNDFLHTYAWDANGRPVTIDGVGITYDALGRMVEQNRSGAYTQMVYSPTGFLMQIMNGQASKYNFTPNPGGGETVWSSSALTYYRHADWLGSSRFASTYTRAMFYDGAYAPFGEQYANSGTSDLSFTGMDSDTSANLYDFPAREYGIQGRWPSPDPAGLDAVDPSNPQSWNRYAYALNNPLAMTDPSGLCPECLAACSDPILAPICIVGIVGSILDFFKTLFDFFAPPPPQAAPAPPGGYGAGIDPYGTWNEKVPKGVQVFPSSITGIPNGSGCTYGSGSCGGMIYGFTNGGTAPWNSYSGYLDWLRTGLTLAGSVVIGMPQSNAPVTQSLQTAKKWGINFLCGTSPSDAVWQWAKDGAIKGLVVGSVTGGVTGAVFGVGVGAPFGAILGGLAEGTIGGTAGIAGGAVAAGVCYASGVYK